MVLDMVEREINRRKEVERERIKLRQLRYDEEQKIRAERDMITRIKRDKKDEEKVKVRMEMDEAKAKRRKREDQEEAEFRAREDEEEQQKRLEKD